MPVSTPSESRPVFSLQALFRNKDVVFQLLQASADAAHDAARAVHELTSAAAEGNERDNAARLAAIRAARLHEKQLTLQVSEELLRSFVTRLDREDIEAVNAALYRIPKTAGKFAARYALVKSRVRGLDFGARTHLLLACTEVVAEMVGEMRRGLRIAPMHALQKRLQAFEGEADRLLLEPYGGFYLDEPDPVRVLLAKDLFETLEEAIDACRDVGNVIYAVVLKNS